MTTATELLKIQSWLSPAFPTGGFSYSQGLEWLITQEDLRDPSGWIADLLAHGSLWSDAVLFAAAWRAPQDAGELAALARAMSPGRERLMEAEQQGEAFLDALAAWPPLPEPGAPASLCVVAGAAFGLHGLPLEECLAAYLNAQVTSLISVAVRLVPIGQKAGLAALASLQPAIAAAAAKAASSSLEDIGGMGFAHDIAGMRHEAQERRIFRS